jgi:hypothetical protein
MKKIPTEWKVMESHNPFHGSSHHHPGLIPMKSPFSYGFPMFQTCPNQADQSATAKRHGICPNFASRDPPSGTTGHVTGTDEKLDRFRFHLFWAQKKFRPEFISGNISPENIYGLNYMVPSGKLSHNYGKSPCLMGKSTINHHFQ